MVKREKLLPFAGLHPQCFRVFKIPSSMYDLNSAPLCKNINPIDQLFDDGILPRPHLFQIDGRFTEVDPPDAGFSCLLDQLCCSVCGIECRRVSAWPTAEDHKL